MTIGIIWALVAGLMLGLYALPGKFTKDFKEENTWGLFFMLTMFAVPLLATATLLKGTGQIYADPAVKAVLPVMIISSVLWGIGVMMWGKAIHHIGLSLGFSLFIGTVIFVGSVLPIGIGLAYLIYYFVVGRKEAETMEAAQKTVGADPLPPRRV